MLAKSFDGDFWEVYNINTGKVLARFGSVYDADDYIDNFIK